MQFVRGTYEGRSQNYAFQLRFDFDADGIAGDNLVSGDQFLGPAIDPAAFQASFVSVGLPTVDQEGAHLVAVLNVVGRRADPWTTQGTLECLRQTDGTVAATLRLFSGTDPAPYQTYQFPLSRTSSHLRTVRYQLDVLDSTADARLDRFLGLAEQNFDRAGIRLERVATAPLANPEPDREWFEDELHSWLVKRGPQVGAPPGLAWQVYLMVVPTLRSTEDGDIAGVMFDEDEFPRQAAAVAWRAHGAPGVGDFDRNFERTITHELGHAFNLLHSWDPDKASGPRLGSASYMNYPDRFEPRQGDGYWPEYLKQHNFDPDELFFMRHGHMEVVIMGGVRFGAGGHDVVPQPIGRPAEVDGLRLSLRLTPADREPMFEFGESVHVEAKLEKGPGAAVPAADVLDPTHRATHYLIRRAGGPVRRFRPLMTRCGSGRPVVLSAGNRALYEECQISYGADGLYFLEPGPYEVQAVYTAGSAPLASNVLNLWVRYPTRDVETLVVPTLTREVGTYFATWGHPGLSGAIAELDNLVAGSRRRNAVTRQAVAPIIREFQRCQYHSTARGHRAPVRDERGRAVAIDHRKPDPIGAEDALADSLKVDPEALPDRLAAEFDQTGTIRYGHLCGTLYKHAAAHGRPHADRYLTAAAARFDRLKVPAVVRDRYRRRWA